MNIIFNTILFCFYFCFSFCSINTYSSSLQQPQQQQSIQPPLLTQLTDAKGGTVPLVGGVAQDSAGFVWVLDFAQVYRYDGFGFDKLAEDVIAEAIMVDSKDRLWLSGAYCLIRYDLKKNQLSNYSNLAVNDQPLNYQNVRAMIQMPQGKIIIGSDAGLSVYDESGDRFINFQLQLPGSHENAKVNALMADGHSQLLVATDVGLFALDVTLLNAYVGKIIKLNTPWLEGVEISAVEKIDEHVYAVGSFNGLYLLEPNANKRRKLVHDSTNPASLSDNVITSVLKVSSSKIWIGTNLGLDIFDIQTGQIQRLKQPLLSSEGINALYRKDNNVYVSTVNGVYLHQLPNENKQVLNRRQHMFADNEQVKSVWSIFSGSDQQYLLGTYGLGLFELDGQDNVTRYTYEGKKQQGISSNNVSVVFQDSKEGTWIGTTRGVSYRPKGASDFVAVPLSSSVNLQTADNVRDIIEDQQGNMWILTTTLLLKINHDFEPLQWFSRKTTPALEYQLWASTLLLHQDKLLVGSDTTFTVIDLSSNTLVNSTQVNSVSRIFKDSQGTIWVLAFDQLYRYNPLDGSLSTVADDHYFSDRNKAEGIAYYNLAEDRFGQLWIAYKGGVRVFDIEQQEFVASVVDDNFANLNLLFGRNSMAVSPDGDILFAELDGVSRFTPSKIELKSRPGVMISAIVKTFDDSGKSSLLDSFKTIDQSGESAVFDHRLIKLEFEFTTADILHGQQAQFKYYLEGFENSWQLLSNSRTATYGALPYGHYTLWLKSVVQGRESVPLRYDFEVVPPPWLTWWAKWLYGLLICCGIVALIKCRTIVLEAKVKMIENTVLQRTEELLKKNQRISLLMLEKEQLIENVFHQSRTPIQIMLANLNRLKADKLSVQRYVEQQLKCIEQLLYLTDRVLLDQYMGEAKLQVQAVDLGLVQLAERYVMLAEQRDFVFEWYIEPNVIIKTDMRMLEDIVDNLLSNSFKYTRRGVVQLFVGKIDQLLVVRCQDTGIGIAEDELQRIRQRHIRGYNIEGIEGSGIGLALVEMFVYKLNGQLTFASKPNEGCKVEVSLPLEASGETPLAQEVDRSSKDLSESVQNDNSNQEKQQILLIEDNKILVEYYHSVLAPHYRVTAMLDGAKAMEHAMAEVPDIIVTDAMLGHFSGYELVKTIRNNDITRHIPVIMITAKADFDSKLKGFEYGANDYIIKPVQENELLIRIQNQLTFVGAVERRSNSGVTPTNEQEQHSTDKLVDAYCQYVRLHFGEIGITNELISEKLFVTKKQLERKISQCLGTTPNQYLASYRLDQAKMMLLKGKSIKMVYEQCGFSSHAYFSKKFKQKYDCSPSEFVQLANQTDSDEKIKRSKDQKMKRLINQGCKGPK